MSDGIVVISGGSAANSLVDVFRSLAEQTTRKKSLSYVIGISDNGGSTSELIRVFGGPGIGDIRSIYSQLCCRLVRLVPDDPNDRVKSAIKRLLNYRLPDTGEAARSEWTDIVEGRHDYWKDIPSEKRELLRSFFIYINAEITKRARPSSAFNFQLASLGNLFLTSCRLFFGSLESAIYLTHSILGMPENVEVIPALNSNFSHHIAAGLSNGLVIAGQNQISHPAATEDTCSSSYMTPEGAQTPINVSSVSTSEYHHRPIIGHDIDEVEDANLPGSLPSLRKGNIVFTKEQKAELPASIERIWYINPYGQEIRPPTNPKVLAALNEADTLIYSIGSLYTSIIPCLITRGVGQAISETPSLRYKILILNGSYDREIGPGQNFNALDFIKAITFACVESRGTMHSEVRKQHLNESKYKNYVTHVVYLQGQGIPSVNVEKLKELGIVTWQVYGRRNTNANGEGKGMIYDVPALKQALEMIVGRKTSGGRRSTVDITNAAVFVPSFTLHDGAGDGADAGDGS